MKSTHAICLNLTGCELATSGKPFRLSKDELVPKCPNPTCRSTNIALVPPFWNRQRLVIAGIAASFFVIGVVLLWYSWVPARWHARWLALPCDTCTPPDCRNCPPAPQAPTIILLDSLPRAGDSVRFTSADPGRLLQWDFDGNGEIDSRAASPKFRYNKPGSYLVTCYAENGTESSFKVVVRRSPKSTPPKLNVAMVENSLRDLLKKNDASLQNGYDRVFHLLGDMNPDVTVRDVRDSTLHYSLYFYCQRLKMRDGINDVQLQNFRRNKRGEIVEINVIEK